MLTCTVAVKDAAQNHCNLAWNVCRKKTAQISLVEYSQLGDILCIGIVQRALSTISCQEIIEKWGLASGNDWTLISVKCQCKNGKKITPPMHNNIYLHMSV